MLQYKVFGCKTNRYFAEKWLVHPYLCDKEGYFIASCIVTDTAKAKWVKYALKVLTNLAPGKKLYLSGCGNIRDGLIDTRFYVVYPELLSYKASIEILPENPDDWREQKEKKPLFQKKIRSIAAFSGKNIFTRKFIVIQTGCDNFCTFCLTVQARGRHMWRPEQEILDEVRAYERSGGKEIVLTGINLGAWGAQSSNNYQESRLVFLIESLLEKTTIERIRISSLGVEFCSDALIALFGSSRIIAYPHLSIQSGSSSVLARMGRHYDGEKVRSVLEKFSRIRRKDAVGLNIGADIIVGFPGEQEEDFTNTLALVEQQSLIRAHTFPFSPHLHHYSVPAGSFREQVAHKKIQGRMKYFRQVLEKKEQAFLQSHTGKELCVLIEKQDHSLSSFSGWSQNYIACNEHNFSPHAEQVLQRGALIRGIYTPYLPVE